MCSQVAQADPQVTSTGVQRSYPSDLQSPSHAWLSLADLAEPTPNKAKSSLAGPAEPTPSRAEPSLEAEPSRVQPSLGCGG